MKIDDLLHDIESILSNSEVLKFIIEEVKMLGYNSFFIYIYNSDFEVILSVQFNPYLEQVIAIQLLVPMGCGESASDTAVSKVSENAKKIDGAVMWFRDCIYIVKEYMNKLKISEYILEICNKLTGRRCKEAFDIIDYSYDFIAFE